MANFELIPAIDLLDGRCVRLSQGRYDAATVYGDDPGDVAAGFVRQAIARLHVVDLDGLKRAPGTDMVKVWEQSRQSLDEHKELYERIITSFQSGNPQ